MNNERANLIAISIRNSPFAIGALLAATTLAAQESASFGGPSSVGGQLAKAPEVRPWHPDADNLKLGFDYSVFGQSASKGSGVTDAVGGVARFYGTATLFRDDAGGTGALTFKVENRHRLSDTYAPQDLGFGIGYVGLTSVTYSNAGWILTNLYWDQTSADNRFAVVAGILDVTDYLDVYAYANPWADFSNLSFSTNPTIPSPNQGLGLAARAMLSDNIYVVAGVADANGDPTRPENAFSSFFDTTEFFTHAEIGWVSSFADRFTDNIHLTLWHADERPEAGVSEGSGVALSASWKFAERFTPFARYGNSSGGGALMEQSASIGLGYTPTRQNDVAAIGVNWGRPASESFGEGLSDQTTVEAFYNAQITPWLQVTPDIQYITDPALAPEIPSMWLFGLRVKATF